MSAVGTVTSIKGWSGTMHKLGRTPAMFALPDSRGRDFWWGEHMDDEAYARLIREIEADKGKLSAHELVCAERYKRIEDKFGGFEKKLDAVILQAMNEDAQEGNWRTWIIGIVIAGLLATVGWTSGQLYELQPLRPSVEKHK